MERLLKSSNKKRQMKEKVSRYLSVAIESDMGFRKKMKKRNPRYCNKLIQFIAFGIISTYLMTAILMSYTILSSPTKEQYNGLILLSIRDIYAINGTY